MFIRPAYECLLFTENMQAISNICAFLTKMNVQRIPENIKDFCFNFIIQQYEIFSQKSLLFPNQEPVPVPPGSFLDTIDTDIVASPGFSHDITLAPVRHCFEFLCSLPLKSIAINTDIFNEQTFINSKSENINSNYKNKNGRDRVSDLFYLCIYLAPVFEKIALEEALKIQEYRVIDENTLWNLVIETFKNTSKEQVAATCLNAFAQTTRPLPLDIQIMIENYLLEQSSEDTELLFYTFVLVDQKEHEKAIQAVPTMTQHLPYRSAAILLYKLAYVLGKSMVDSINDHFSIALLQYGLTHGGIYEERVINYLKNHSYSRWPLGDPQMDEDLASFLSLQINKNQNNSTSNVPKFEKIKLGSLKKLSQDHWKFLINHSQFFELCGVIEYLNKNLDSFKKN